MNTNQPTWLRRAVHIAALALALTAAVAPARAAESPKVSSRTAKVDGITLHYFTAGSGKPLIFIHGYAQSAHMWSKIMPQFAERFQVIAPDLPGFGESEIPASGLDMKTAATRIHALALALGVQKASVVGHDIGLMVAYAYAAMHPTEVERLVLMDAFLPGIGQWESFYRDPQLWHFFFNGPTPEALVKGRERTYFEHFWNDFAADKARSLSQADRALYTTDYARTGRMRAGWAYFAAFPQTARDFAELGKTRLTLPVLVIAGEKAGGDFLGRQVKLIAPHATEVVLKSTGHWVLDENPKETTEALERFLGDGRS
jgi:pimeloyl-ACP methyl ester carboxylesterase